MVKSKHKHRRRYWINPHVHCGCDCGSDAEDHEEGCVDKEDAYRLIYEIPGVKKENISIKVVKNGVRLNAIRDAHVEYYNEYSFLTEGDPENIVVQYEEGLLVVNVPIIGKDPFKDVEPVKF